eukprot:8993431-Alexandrium_andersonii.AAC.1
MSSDPGLESYRTLHGDCGATAAACAWASRCFYPDVAKRADGGNAGAAKGEREGAERQWRRRLPDPNI